MELVSPRMITQSGFASSSARSRLRQHLAGLLAVTARSDFQVDIRLRQLQMLKKYPRHAIVVVLPGVDEDLMMLPAQRAG